VKRPLAAFGGLGRVRVSGVHVPIAPALASTSAKICELQAVSSNHAICVRRIVVAVLPTVTSAQPAKS
jgi:hypothetical protein